MALPARPGPCLLGSLAALAVASVGAAEDAEALLERFVRSERELSYRMTLVVSDARPPQVLEYVQRAGSGTELRLLSGPAEHQALSDWPDHGPELSPARRLQLLHAAYQPEWGQTQRLAQRPVRPVRFLARDGLRFTTVLWLDLGTGVPLKTQVLDVDGRLLEHSVASHFETLGEAVAEPPGRSIRLDWRVAPLPTGFIEVGAAVSGARQQLVLHDGLSAVSVFVEPGSGAPAGAMRIGAMASLAREEAGTRFTAVGGVPLVTLERVLNAVVRR